VSGWREEPEQKDHEMSPLSASYDLEYQASLKEVFKLCSVEIGVVTVE
jgi:hypothetical protein